MLKIQNLYKSYGSFEAISGLNFNVNPGALYGIVGPNGAGKTTLIRMIMGLLEKDSGEIFIDGELIKKRDRSVYRKFGYVPDYFGFYENLTVWEYMVFFAEAFHMDGLMMRRRNMELLERVGLEKKADVMVDTLSRGMQQRLSFARALIHDPKFVLMDEPASGLDPRTRYEFKELVRELGEEGKTILISSHILTELSEICTDIGIMESGRMVASGTISDILHRVEQSNPICIEILDAMSTAMAIFKEDPHVTAVTQDGHKFEVQFDGDKINAAELLQKLIAFEVPVTSLVREPGTLETFFMQMTDHKKGRVVLSNDYESNI